MPEAPKPDGSASNFNRTANFFPPGCAVRAIRPTDNEAVRSLFIAGQIELAPAGATPELRIALKKYTDSCLNEDMNRASVHYSKPGRRMWVMESQEKAVVAMIGLDNTPPEPGVGFLRRLVVAPHFRRKGVARLLTQRAEQYAARQGLAVLRLEVSDLQPGARKMYDSFGYREVRSFDYGPIVVFDLEKRLPR